MLLSDAVDHYRADRVAKGYAKGTVANEQSLLRMLLADIGNIQVSSITSSHLDRFWHKHQDWMPGTFNKNRAYLSGFFKWCQIRGHMPRTTDPLEGTRNRRVVPREQLIIPQSKFEELLDAAPIARDRIVLAIGLYLFCRVSEISNLRWRDLNFDQKAVRVFRTKTTTEDILPMCEELEHELKRWRLEYGREAGEVPKAGWYVCPPYSPPKFAGRSGRQAELFLISPRALRPTAEMVAVTERIQLSLASAGYEDLANEGGHTLRRSGAVALYNELIDRGHDGAIRMVQAMLGHSSVMTTEIYLRLDLARKTRNDLLAGKRMFSAGGGEVVNLEGHRGRDHSQGLSV